MKKIIIKPVPFRLAMLTVLLGLSRTVVANDVNAVLNKGVEAEFDSSFLTMGKSQLSIDVRRFKYGNPWIAGDYEADIFVNNERRGLANIKISEGEHNGYLCFTPELSQVLDLTSEAIQIPATSSECIDVDLAVPKGKFRFDYTVSRLHLEIPQIYVVQRPRGYISPHLWQTGVPVAFLNYDLNSYQHYGNTSYQQHYLALNGGINLGDWAFRHIGAKSWDSSGESSYHRIATYVKRPIVPLRSELTVGDFTTDGAVVEAIGLRGVRLASDDRMLPTSLRGYAPTVRGIAHSNARVTISQNGHIIRQLNVPAGAFEISDLNPTGYSGELHVEVLEASGEIRSFKVPFAYLVPLMRPKQFKYQLAGGRYRYGNSLADGNVFQASFQYGLLNNLSANFGGTYHDNYRAGSVGLALATPIGGFALDYTRSNAYAEALKQRYQGDSVRASYNMYIQQTDTNVMLATYRYNSKDYYTLSETMWLNDSHLAEPRMLREMALFRPKHQFQMTISQNFGDKWGSLYLMGSLYRYWGKRGAYNEYQLSYSNYWRNLNYQFSYSYMRNLEYHSSDRQWHLGFSLPLGKSHRSYLSNTISDVGNSRQLQTTFTQTVGKKNQLNYSITSSSDLMRSHSVAFSGNYRMNQAQFNLSGTYDNAGGKQLAMGMSGAIVAHPKGVTLSHSVGDSFAIIHAQGASGTEVGNGIESELDHFGNAIVPYLTPYQKNYISIDPSRMPINMEFSATEREVIPKANSALLVDFVPQINTMVLFELKYRDGEEVPMASEAFEGDEHIGYVVQGGTLFANKLRKTSGKIHVKWGDNANEQCSFNYAIPTLNNKNTVEIASYPVECK